MLVSRWIGADMVFLLCLLMILVPCLLGKGALRILYGKHPARGMTWADRMLAGWMLVTGSAEAAHLGAVVLGRSFSDCEKLFLLIVAALLLIALALLFLESFRKRQHKSAQREAEREAERIRLKESMEGRNDCLAEQILFLVFGAIVLIQVLSGVAGQKIYPAGDMTTETVNSILATDSVYQVNPLTGQAYTLGMPLRLKILCLPTLYAFLCDLFGLSADLVVWTIVPAFILLGSYVAFYTVAGALFPGDRRKRGIFMIFVALVLWVGDYMYGMDGFGVQYAGFRGVTIRMAILLPYTFGLILRKKWRLVPLCILAEACIVWTLYGMGWCLFVAAAMLFLGMLNEKRKRLIGGEEEPACRN